MQPAKKIKRDKTPEQAYAALIRLCARSEKSSGDALRLMQRWGVKPSARQGVLQKLLADRFIDDNRYAEAFVRGKAGRFGASRLRSELARRGIDRDLIDEAIAGECVESEADRARAVLRGRFTEPPADAREWARQARFLQTRGFAPDLIRKLLKEPYDESA